MYVAKFDKEKFLWRVTIFEKRWSELILSNEISEIKNKTFFFHSSGYRWMNKEMSRIMFEQHKLEIING
jgi:hypothetical protein